jgi:hypothetical protein
MVNYKEIKNSLLHLLFPHVCDSCGSDIIDEASSLCMKCIAEMPQTNFHLHANNPIEKIFWGRLPIINATAQYYFVKGINDATSHASIKYKGNKELGKQLGRFMGYDLKKASRFNSIDLLVPLPLFPQKKKEGVITRQQFYARESPK